jgi:hypothetical protein
MRASAHVPSIRVQCAYVSAGLIIRDDPAAVGDYVANYIAKRYHH